MSKLWHYANILFLIKFSSSLRIHSQFLNFIHPSAFIVWQSIIRKSFLFSPFIFVCLFIVIKNYTNVGFRILILLSVLLSTNIIFFINNIINFHVLIAPDLECGDIIILAPLSFRNGSHCCLINALFSGSMRYSRLILNSSASIMEALGPFGKDWYLENMI